MSSHGAGITAGHIVLADASGGDKITRILRIRRHLLIAPHPKRLLQLLYLLKIYFIHTLIHFTEAFFEEVHVVSQLFHFLILKRNELR